MLKKVVCLGIMATNHSILIQKVHRVENVFASDFKTKRPSEKNPQRPDYGTRGKEVILWANHFNLHAQKDLELYRYAVVIAPDARGRVPAGKRYKRIIELLLEGHFVSYKDKIATDFKSNLISVDKLGLDKDEFVVAYRFEEEDIASPDATQHRCRVQRRPCATGFRKIYHRIRFFQRE